MTIEWWFKYGARFRWPKPDDLAPSQDGAVVASPATTSTIKYDGVEMNVVPKPDIMQWTTFTANAVVAHSWLCYCPGRTTETPLNNDILTGYMSGCLIVQFVENGQRKVAHVGTRSDAPNALVKSTFRNKLMGLTAAEQLQVSGYNPAAAWDATTELVPLANKINTGDGDAKIFSLTTSGGQFYSIAMGRRSKYPTVWTSGGCKQIGGMAYNAVVAALT